VTDPRKVLERAGLSAKKSFGQNFLVASHVVDSIAAACVPDAEIGKAHVVELGAGTGALTRALCKRAARVIAVERDRDLVPVLNEELAEEIAAGKLAIVEGDAQSAVAKELAGDVHPLVLCGNLPYQITGRLLERAVVQADDLDRAVFMVQLEVAERLAAEPGSKIYGALTVFTRAAFRTKKLFNVSPGSFHPPPDVTSAIIAFEPERPRRAAETPTFRALVKGAFTMRRKTLRNAWAGVAPAERIRAAAERASVSLDARGETLDVDAFARMARALDSA
jgi:16S rRNA (adenine1518-N6/adenine1519-N6)-dimethyltransferase